VSDVVRPNARRARLPSGQVREVAGLLRALADQLEAGRARANLRIEIEKERREVWLVAATVLP
jgi:hypothetical protein